MFWPIWGNWEKRNRRIEMSLTGCLSIAFTAYPPRQYSESLRQHQDTSQTPSRQPSDIPKHLVEKEPADQITLIGSNWSIQGHWQNINQAIETILNVPSLEFHQLISQHTPFLPSRQYPESLRQPPDTFQTTSRHSKAPGREGTSWSDYSNWI